MDQILTTVLAVILQIEFYLEINVYAKMGISVIFMDNANNVVVFVQNALICRHAPSVMVIDTEITALVPQDF